MNEDKQEPAWATSLKRETLKISVKETHKTPTAQRNCQVERDSQRKEGLSGVEDFSTEQPHFGGMCQEGADNDLPRLCGPSDGDHVNVMRSGGMPEAPATGGSFNQVPRTTFLGVTHMRRSMSATLCCGRT